MAQKITYWLLITLILSLGFGQLLRFDFYGLSLYLHDILVVAILGLQGLTLKEVPNPIKGIKIFLTGVLVSWLFAFLHYPISSLLVPSLYTLRLLSYLALFFVVKTPKLSIPKLYFLISATMTLIIGLLQYILLPDMRVFQYLGWDDHLNRLVLPHFDPTFTGVMLGLTALSFPKYSPLYSIGILLTYARSVFLSLILTLFFSIKNKLILILAISCMLLAIFFLPKRFGEGTNLFRIYSITSRIESDFSYLKKYKWDLLIGRGMNTLILDAPKSRYDNHASGPNNSYLYLLATTGITGLIGWGLFLKHLYHKSLYKPMLTFLLIASLFNNVMFYPFALLWVLLIESMAPNAV